MGMTLLLLLLFSDYGLGRLWCMDEFAFMAIRNNDNNAISCKFTHNGYWMVSVHSNVFISFLHLHLLSNRSTKNKLNNWICNAVCAWAGYIYRIIFFFGWLVRCIWFSHISPQLKRWEACYSCSSSGSFFPFNGFFFGSVWNEISPFDLFFASYFVYIMVCSQAIFEQVAMMHHHTPHTGRKMMKEKQKKKQNKIKIYPRHET